MNSLGLYRFIYLGKDRGVTLRVHPLTADGPPHSGLILFSRDVDATILNMSKQSKRVE